MKSWYRKFWNFIPGEKIRELVIDGEIATESWFDDDVTPKMFREELESGSGDIIVRINSPGGDCIAASQIYSMLQEYPGKVTVKIDGLAASAASVIAMAGENVEMAATALIMIHNPAMLAFGDHNEMEKAIEVLSEVKESIINAYEMKTGLSRNKINKLMEEETWMNAKRAIELGFADKISEVSTSDVAPFDFSIRRTENAVANSLYEKSEKNHKNTGRKISDLKEKLKLKEN